MDSKTKDKQEGKENKMPKKVTTEVKCPHCGKVITAEVEVPEAPETPKVTWIT